MVALKGSQTRPVRDGFVDCARRTDGNETTIRKARAGTRRMISHPRKRGSPERTLGLPGGQHPKGSPGDSRTGRLPTPQKRDASGPSAEINQSNIWILWENPTDKDDTRRWAVRELVYAQSG